MRTHRRVRALTGTCAHSQAQRQTPHHKRARAREKRRGKGVGELAAGGARAGRRDAGRGHGQNRPEVEGGEDGKQRERRCDGGAAFHSEIVPAASARA